MEKISSIIPSTSRVTTVDMSDAHPVRPGVPTFGRPTGISNLRRNINRSHIDAQLADPNLTERQRGSLKHAKIVEDISAGFFMQKAPAETPAATFELSPAGQDLHSIEYKKLAEYEAFPEMDEGPVAMGDEPEYLAPGSYIDVTV